MATYSAVVGGPVVVGWAVEQVGDEGLAEELLGPIGLVVDEVSRFPGQLLRPDRVPPEGLLGRVGARRGRPAARGAQQDPNRQRPPHRTTIGISRGQSSSNPAASQAGRRGVLPGVSSFPPRGPDRDPGGIQG